jgi:transcriptional regulator with XRE-family HTH domain
MQTAESNAQLLHESGFPKKIARTKHNLLLNKRLKSARLRNKMSAMSVVKKLKSQGVSVGHSTIVGYEADEKSLNHRYPSLPMLFELADLYGCSIDYLFGRTDRYKPVDLSVKQIDILDLLEGNSPVGYDGIKLTKKQKDLIRSQLEMVLKES